MQSIKNSFITLFLPYSLNWIVTIRGIRGLKKLSQENVAKMLGLSVLAYGDIERGKTDIKLSRLHQIAEVLGVTTSDILKFGDALSNFFEKCSQTNVVTGQNGNQTYYNSPQELQHQLEKAELALKNCELKMENLSLKLEKSEATAKYWQEKFEQR